MATVSAFYLIITAATVSLVSIKAEFNLTILHTNDIHARFDEVNPVGFGPCTDELRSTDDCFGGIARRVTAINNVREAEDNVILLDAGDQLQGPLWFYIYQGFLTSTFMNRLSYDAMAIGLHEFDMGVDKLTEFIRNLTFPALACNINTTEEPEFASVITYSHVITVGGERLGVVGFTDESNVNHSITDDLIFQPIVNALQTEVDRLLSDENVTKIIGLGHTYIPVLMEIANRVRGIDVIVFGRPIIFLYSGTSPDDVLEPYGDYPIVVRPDYDPGRTVIMVMVYPFGKYLGRINIVFDESGEIVSYNGNPILLDSSVVKDQETVELLDSYRGPVEELARMRVGYSLVTIDGSLQTCGFGECNAGNSFTDAFLDYFLNNSSFPYWSDINFAVSNSGGFLESFKQGELTFGELSYVIPFGDILHIIEMKGEHILEMLEYSGSGLGNGVPRFEFLQVSGLRLEYDISRTPGNRLIQALTLCKRCAIPKFVPIEKDTIYKFVTNSYVASGGDGHFIIPETLISRVKGPGDKDVWVKYLTKTSPVWTGLEGRITITRSLQACANPRPDSILSYLCQLALV